MALSSLFNRAKMSVASAPGTGAITLGAAAVGFQTFAAAGMTNGVLGSYLIEDGANWEIGQGTYTASGTTLARTAITGSSNGGAAIPATANAVVSLTVLAADFNQAAALLGTTLPANVTASSLTSVGALTSTSATPLTCTTSAGDPAITLFDQVGSSGGASLNFIKDRGVVNGTNTVNAGDSLGQINFSGYYKTNSYTAGSIAAVATTWNSNYQQASLNFQNSVTYKFDAPIVPFTANSNSLGQSNNVWSQIFTNLITAGGNLGTAVLNFQNAASYNFDAHVLPATTNSYNLGNSTKQWASVYTNSVSNYNGVLNFSNSTSYNFDANILPTNTNSYAFGSSTKLWQQVWTASINTTVATFAYTGATTGYSFDNNISGTTMSLTGQITSYASIPLSASNASSATPTINLFNNGAVLQGPYLNFSKSRGAAGAAVGDFIGSIQFIGYSTSAAGNITGYIANVVASNNGTTVTANMQFNSAASYIFDNTITAPAITLSGPATLKSYTVATLPTAGVAGRTAWASNGRAMNGAYTFQGAGAGTGCLVNDNGTGWQVAGTIQAVAA